MTSVSFDANAVKRTDLAPDFQPFIGDYIGIAATPLNAYPLWADNRFACDTFDSVYQSCVYQDAFTAKISLADFTISTNLTTQTITQGRSGAANLTLTSLSGFQGNVNVTSSSSPTSLPISPATKILTIPAAGTGSFTTSTPTATYTVNVASTSGPRSHSTQITIIVNPSQSVGGNIIPLDKLGLLLQFLPAAILISSVFTAGVVAVKAPSRNKERRPASFSPRYLALNENQDTS